MITYLRLLLLLLISCSVLVRVWSCSCWEFPAFCDSAVFQDVFLGRVVYQGVVDQEDLPTPYTTIAILLPVGDTEVWYDTISLLNQNGLNCNDDITGYLPGDSLIISILNEQFIEWGPDASDIPTHPSYDLFGCGSYFLPVQAGRVGGTGLRAVALTDFVNDPANHCPQPIVATQELSRKYQFEVYPNPAESKLRITYTGELPQVLLLYDAHGQLLRQLQLTSTPTELPLEGLPAGLYYLQEQVAVRPETIRFIIQ